ncbi:type I-E CRISPR-associated protein Cse2/CasB [Streptomyces sp. RS10V-4]|uniref:type I-E CRISPR-associated protein Cse2/CasB n=1 Tax=Streptomyces rhizoryzae TaxID=2932493 RepID=UPI0020054624|nr:type I-E CRISPR-associated protein Cse2/CasB [Streptomyces rhizoryzae]MCK7627618.1 type I-E CRISPR-associated protein Cse2/CasB [Streptomyces rhizoryzae]
MTPSRQQIDSASTAGNTAPGDPSWRSLPRAAAVRTINRLQSGYRLDRPAAVAAVARLRREAGQDAHASPTSWGLDDLAALTELRERKDTEDDGAALHRPPETRRERERREAREDRQDQAVHIAVTLWALHQQSVRDEPMHVAGWSLGRAVRRLSQVTQEKHSEPVEEISPTIRKRFVRIGTSADIDTLRRRLREMVLLLRAARIPLDYGLLADQLDRWQDEWNQGDVRRAWGRDFHRVHRTTATADPAGEGTTASLADDAPI